ncbi:acyltransferase family protein [Streptomyces purpureus]|uniref:acyltransferase family protein n=1 Tax=Streptomyces purpureus TaxID=1951 RepID=UPI0003A71796|nr:acyltransferase [Streptomyces purpureus]
MTARRPDDAPAPVPVRRRAQGSEKEARPAPRPGPGAVSGAVHGPAFGGRLPSLTGLRFFAALAVFAFHATFDNLFADRAVGERFAFWLGSAGWVGVSFFFVLSGFLLTVSARPKDTARAFWRRRLVKIYPSHLAAGLLALVLMWLTGRQITDVWENLLLVQVWVPDVTVILSVNPVSWSLACEAVFYLAFPLLLRGVRRLGPAGLVRAAATLAAAVGAMPALAALLTEGGPDMGWLPVSEDRYWFLLAFPPVRALEFVLGMVMARIVTAGRYRGPGMALSLALLAAAYLTALHAPIEYSFAALTLLPVTAVICAAARQDRSGVRSWLHRPLLQYLGACSFAFYLLHRLVQFYGHHALGPTRTFPTLTAFALIAASAVVTGLAAHLMHTRLEIPLMRRYARPRRPGRRRGGVGVRSDAQERS